MNNSESGKWVNMEYSKSLYEYLNGDVATIGYVIPYASGPDIISFGKSFTDFPCEYKWGGTNLSRWDYTKKLVDYSESRISLAAYFHTFFVKKIVPNNSKESQRAFLEDINKKLSIYGQRLSIKERKMVIENVPIETILDDIELDEVETKNKEDTSETVVGEGGMADIFTTDNDDILCKKMKNPSLKSPLQIQRFKEEFRILKLIGDNVHVLKVFELDETNVSFTMSKAEGSFESLKTEMSEDEIISYFSQIATNIQFIHKLNILHRDIKPDNTLKVNGRWVLSDFGLSKGDDSPALTVTGQYGGTDGYICPELLNNNVLWKKGYLPKFDGYAFGHSIISTLKLIKNQEKVMELTRIGEALKNYTISIDDAVIALRTLYINM